MTQTAETTAGTAAPAADAAPTQVAAPDAAVTPPDPAAALGNTAQAAAQNSTNDPAQPKDGAAFKPHDFLPDHLRGGTLEETYQKLSDFYKNQRDSAATTPSKAEDYTYVPQEDIKAYLPQADQDPAINAAKQAAHKHGISQKSFQGFLDDVLGGFIKEGFVPPLVDDALEKKKLAPEGLYKSDQERIVAGEREINTLKSQLEVLEQRGTLNAAQNKELGLMLVTADGVSGLRALLSLSDTPSIRLSDGGAAASGESWEDYINGLRDPKYNSLDPSYNEAFRKRIDALGDRVKKPKD